MTTAKLNKKSMNKAQRLLLGLLFLMLAIFMFALLKVVVNEHLFFKNLIKNVELVEIVSGGIKTVKYYHGGKSNEVMKFSVEGFNKWLLMGKVNEEDAAYFVKGQKVDAEVYQMPASFLSRQYNQIHTVRTLGVKVNKQVIRTSEDRRRLVVRNGYLMIVLTTLGLAMALVGIYFISKTPAKVIK